MTRTEQLKTWLAGANSRRLTFLLGLLLALPSIGSRLLFDDHLQALLRMPKPPIDGLLHTSVDLYTFGKPGPVNDTFIERGIIVPWWTYPGYRVSFFRPLSAFTHVVDGWLWSRSPVMAHVQSIAWYVLLLTIVSRLYSRLVQPAWLAGLAFLVFALDDTHGDVLGWIANRHAVIAAVLGLFSFDLHVTSRKHGKQSGWGPVSFALALLAGEAATSVCAYLLAYALFVDRASRRSRALSVLPYAIIALSWRLAYQRLGYGAFGGDDYIDPAREPLRFLARFPQAFLALLQAELGGLASDFWSTSTPAEASQIVAVALVGAAVIFFLAYPLLRMGRTPRFWCASLVGALIPSTASTPTDRNLLFAGVAGGALFAQMFGAVLEREFWWREPGARRTLAAVPMAALAARKLLVAPLLFPIRDRMMDRVWELNDRAADAVPNVSDMAERNLIIPNPPNLDLATFIPLIRATSGQAVPRTVRLFATSAMTLTRTSDRELLVRPKGGFIASDSDRTFRSVRYPMRLGEKVQLSDMSITITELRPEGNPAAALFAFREPLESPKHVWLAWDQQGCHSFAPPRVGETIALSAVDTWKLAAEMWSSPPGR